MWRNCGSCVRTRRVRGNARCATSTFLAKSAATLPAMDTGRFGKLYFKLFLAIAGAIGALTIATYFVFSASFERGFIQYLYRADETRLDWMVEQLAQGYARERSWA